MKRFNKLIYLVDDDPIFLELLEMLLSNIGYIKIEKYLTAEECKNNLYKMPDVIILDYNLDDVLGIDVLKDIVSFDPDISVIMLSSQSSIPNAIETLQYGAFNYVTKDDHAATNIDETIERIFSLKNKVEYAHKKKKKKIMLAPTIALFFFIIAYFVYKGIFI